MRLEVKNAGYHYPGSSVPVFQNLSFELEDNQILTILGKNGIGKTTLLKCIMGIYKWDFGSTILNGIPVSSPDQLKNIAYVPQAHGLSYPYTALQLVTMGRFRHMGMLAIPSRRDKELAAQAIIDVGMEDYMHRECSRMSGGQLQLIFIARALAAEPEMLIMDEPESNLDFKNQYLILARRSKCNSRACTMHQHGIQLGLHIIHDSAQPLRSQVQHSGSLCNTLIFCNRGKILQLLNFHLSLAPT